MSRVKILGALACLLVAAIAAAVTGLVSPRPASASTGCCVALSDVVQSSSALFVTTSEGAVVDHAYRLTVNDVLKGTPAPALTYRAVPGEPAMPRGSRWIIVIYPADPDALRTGVLNGRWDQAWAVAANGQISLPPSSWRRRPSPRSLLRSVSQRRIPPRGPSARGRRQMPSSWSPPPRRLSLCCCRDGTGSHEALRRPSLTPTGWVRVSAEPAGLVRPRTRTLRPASGRQGEAAREPDQLFRYGPSCDTSGGFSSEGDGRPARQALD